MKHTPFYRAYQRMLYFHWKNKILWMSYPLRMFFPRSPYPLLYASLANNHWINRNWVIHGEKERTELSAIGYIDTSFLVFITLCSNLKTSAEFGDALLSLWECRALHELSSFLQTFWNKQNWDGLFSYIALINNNSTKLILCSAFLSRVWLTFICFKRIHERTLF